MDTAVVGLATGGSESYGENAGQQDEQNGLVDSKTAQRDDVSDGESLEVEYVPPGGSLPERVVSEEKLQSELRVVRNMWEMAAILDFFSKFKSELNISGDFGAAELEHVLVSSNGDGGLLATLHIVRVYFDESAINIALTLMGPSSCWYWVEWRPSDIFDAGYYARDINEDSCNIR